MNEGQIDIRAILGVVWRRARLIIFVFVAVVAASSAVVFSLKPVFTASTLVLVDTSRKDLLDPSDALTSASTDSARVDSEVELAKSETVLLKVVSDLELVRNPAFAYQPGLVAQALAWAQIRPLPTPDADELLRGVLRQLREAVSVQRRGLTYVIALQARSGDRSFAAELANATAKAYISEQLQAKIDSTLAGRDILQGRVSEASAEVALSEDAVDNFIAANISAIESETGRTDLASMAAEIEALQGTRQRLAATIQTADMGLQSRDFAALTQSLQSDALAALEDQRRELSESLKAAAEGSQTQINLRAELSKIESDLQAAASDAIQGLRQQVSGAQTSEADLRGQLRSNVLSSRLSSSTLTRIYELQQTAEIARSQYDNLLRRLKDLDQQAYLQVADSRIVSEALPPDDPSFPNNRVILALAAVLGLGLGLGLAFLYENFIGGVVTEEQLSSVAKTSSVLTIPSQKEHKGAISLADTVLTHPLSIFSESLRKLRVNVDQALAKKSKLDGSGGAVIMVTSSAPNEGKTTTSLSLARAYALAGKTVLIVDCDLRKPSLHRHLGMDPTTGLIDYLAGASRSTTLSDIVRIDEKSGIGVLLGSRRSTAATDQLVTGATFAKLVAAAVKAFDIVILDTPPIGPVVDAIYLAQFADAAVFVVKWASTSQGEVRKAMTSLVDALPADTDVVGVLSQSARAAAGYYGKYAAYYSEQPSQ